MSKYAPLETFLENSKKSEISMKFEEIEQIIDGNLPASSRKYPAWWSNESSTHVQADAWKNAGYKTVSVDIEDEKLVFVRDNKVEQRADMKPIIHPIFGCMEGTVTIPNGVDITEPAMPEWAEIATNAQLPE